MPALDRSRADQLSKRLGELTEVRVTLILPTGEVVGDSEKSPGQMEYHDTRPEVHAALAGQTLAQTHYSRTLGYSMLYLALPLKGAQDKIVAVVRVSKPLAAMEEQLRGFEGALWRSGAAALLLAIVFSFYLSRRTSRPVEQMRLAAERYAKGDFSQRLHFTSPEEFAGLARSMNRMAQELDGRLREITRQRNEREAILASMREGLLAIDMEEHILMVNHAAEQMLGIEAPDAAGRLVQEVLRNAELQRFLDRALTGEPVPSDESLLHWSESRLIHASSVSLRDEEGRERGLLVVFNDVTRLTRLENLRREFVANVSHELRTPITSIKASIETLRDGAIDEPEHAHRFLEILARQADRLNTIIEDLLALSRLERKAEVDTIELAICPLRPILEAAVQVNEPRSNEKRIRIDLQCGGELCVRANARLLEQAVGNLLDNAIKYSPEGETIRLETEAAEGQTLIRVIDHGCGIPEAALPRLFERFYRVDPARSRELGGTGLGLSIVKHIVQIHGGKVTVESTVGKGSCFTVSLPSSIA